MDQNADALELSRRTFLSALGASGLLAVGGCLSTPTRTSIAAETPDLTPLRSAMHVHTSFSEGGGSLHSQLEEASQNGFDVFWPTDHDWRMSNYRAPTTFHFTGMKETVARRSYTWKPVTTGDAAFARGGIVTSPSSPIDRAAKKGSLMVEVTSAGGSGCSHRYLMDGGASNHSHRTNLTGQTLKVDILPGLVGPHAWAEVRVTMCYRPATAGRPAGTYELTYRVGTTPASRKTDGLRGIVTIALPTGRFGTVTLDPVADAAVMWPDLVAGDNVMMDLELGVHSDLRVPARAHFANLRFLRTQTTGDQPLQVQADMLEQYASRYPSLTLRQGLEVSGPSEHANWFGGEQHLIDYQTTNPTDLIAYAAEMIHRTGGLASLNHPFGTSGGGSSVSRPVQDTARQATAKKFLDRKLGGVDIVEAGYRERGGVDLETSLALFDTFIRSGYWVTATGVNDNHIGMVGSWSKEPNRFYTTLWATSAADVGLLGALRSGAVFVGELGGFDGRLDVSVEGSPMGSVSVRPGAGRLELTTTADGLPAGSSIEVVRGPIDYSNSTDPGTSVVEVIPDSAFKSGQARVGVDASTSCFVRLNVVEASGRRVAFSNPVMLLQQDPPTPVPDERRAPES